MTYSLQELRRDFERTEGIVLLNFPEDPSGMIVVQEYQETEPVDAWAPPIEVVERLHRHVALPSILEDTCFAFRSGHYDRQTLGVLSREGYSFHELKQPYLPSIHPDRSVTFERTELAVTADPDGSPPLDRVLLCFIPIIEHLGRLGGYNVDQVNLVEYFTRVIQQARQNSYEPYGIAVTGTMTHLAIAVVQGEMQKVVECPVIRPGNPIMRIHGGHKSKALWVAANLIDMFDRNDVYEMEEVRQLSEDRPLFRSSVTRIADTFQRATLGTQFGITILHSKIGFRSTHTSVGNSAFMVGEKID